MTEKLKFAIAGFGNRGRSFARPLSEPGSRGREEIVVKAGGSDPHGRPGLPPPARFLRPAKVRPEGISGCRRRGRHSQIASSVFLAIR